MAIEEIVFVCNMGENRSPTGARVFNEKFREEHLDRKYHASYAGINQESKAKLTRSQFDSASLVIAVEKTISDLLIQEYPRTKEKIWQLYISDECPKDSEELVTLFNQVYDEWKTFFKK